MLTILVQSHDLNGNVPRQWILLKMAQDRPAQHVGQEDIQRDRGGIVFARQFQRFGAACRNQYFEAVIVGQIHHRPQVIGIIFHDQQDRIFGFQIIAIVLRSLERRIRNRKEVPVLPTVCDRPGSSRDVVAASTNF